MGLKSDDRELFNQFKAHIEADKTAEILEPTTPWELLRYRREDWVDGHFMGTHDYGIVYCNKRNQRHYTGAAETDYKNWRAS